LSAAVHADAHAERDRQRYRHAHCHGHHRDAKRPSYSCQFCGHHEHPMKGTIFENSATSLKLWFYALYLMTSTRHGVAAST
jgi:hypothetical protein